MSDNADYQRFGVLKTNRNKRYRNGEFIVEGVRNINFARKNGWEFSSFIYAEDTDFSDWAKELLANVKTELNYELSRPLMDALSGKDEPSELVAIIKMRPNDTSRIMIPDGETPLVALFDRPSNRGNLGTIIRSCDALGVHGMIITGHGVDIYDPDVVTSTMGSFFGFPCIYLADNASVESYIAEMKGKYEGFQTVGTTSHHMKTIWETDLTLPTMFMIGNETDGLCRAFKESCDVLATIPMAQTSAASSFNVGCATTVMFYEAIRQRSVKI